MVRVEIIRGVFHAGQVLGVGEVVELEERTAAEYIATGKAVKATAEPEVPKPRGRPRKVMTSEDL